MKKMRGAKEFMLVFLLWSGLSLVRAQEVGATLTISAPVSQQVFQRDAQDNGFIRFRGTASSGADVIEAKVELLEGATRGKGSGWGVIARGGDIAPDGGFSGTLTVQSGGWYKLTVRARKGAHVVGETTVDKVGVGELFVTAGQSNSANFGNPRQKAKDERVVYFNGKEYLPASDPIPGGCGVGGSPWAILGDLIVKSQGVPVCFRSASLTWTEVKNWIPPDTRLYMNLRECVQSFGTNCVRAVLWHQGESDTLVKTSAATYCERLKTITEALSRDCGYPVPWFVAQASFHPGSKEPEQKEVARGQQMLWERKIAFQGPCTDDLLGATYRHDGVHFNEAGLDAHAHRWFDALEKQFGWKSTGANIAHANNQMNNR